MTDAREGTAEMLRRLTPQSVRWLIEKGFAEWAEEDGVRVLRLTAPGHEYVSTGCNPDSVEGTDE